MFLPRKISLLMVVSEVKLAHFDVTCCSLVNFMHDDQANSSIFMTGCQFIFHLVLPLINVFVYN